ncbi:hypothetical protein EYF80_041118 [Liparis tanakae]|uniref:Uncharacterized protein n=1 Tax=Liparis tanakae TaxID=230148 RepID=A0A4Z2G5Y6_9TELE|nr:hypothetical protein EYF80_041118 [Liparis tanakae]
MRVRAAETPKYATKQMSSEDTMPMGMALWGYNTRIKNGRMPKRQKDSVRGHGGKRKAGPREFLWHRPVVAMQSNPTKA